MNATKSPVMFANSNLNLTPKQFELFVCEWLSRQGCNIASLTVAHDQKIEGHDSTYQIDVVAKFEAFAGADFTVLVECKKYATPVEREKVVVLHGKVQSLGAHKGMLFSTSGFQSGAVRYAKVHGIALLTVTDGVASYQTTMLPRQPKKLGINSQKYTLWHVGENDTGTIIKKNLRSTTVNLLDL